VTDGSGSCLLSVLKHNSTLYIANVGDSRAIMSLHRSLFIKELSNDHKPCTISEKQRILSAGGHTWKSETLVKKSRIDSKGNPYTSEKTRYGPERIIPGGLSVSRAIGDLTAKIAMLGGNPECLIAEPEIKKVILKGDEDFLVMACDGVWDV
jgi:protein phosphatase 2C family protein 2/3